MQAEPGPLREPATHMWPFFERPVIKPNEKGQFEPFKMLIGAIMALAVLALIISAINYFGSFKSESSKELFFSGIKNAVEQPTGSPVVIKDLEFASQTVFTQAIIASQTGLENPACMEFLPFGRSSAIKVQAGSVYFTSAVKVDAYATCFTNTSGECTDECEVCCRISFDNSP